MNKFWNENFSWSLMMRGKSISEWVRNNKIIVNKKHIDYNSVFISLKKFLITSFLTNKKRIVYLSLLLLFSFNLFNNFSYANNESIFSIEWLNLNSENNINIWWNNWNNDWWKKDIIEWAEKVWKTKITEDMKTLIQKENEDLSRNWWWKLYVLDQNNDWILDIVLIQNYVHSEWRRSWNSQKLVLKTFDKNLNVFKTIDEENNIHRYVELYKNWKLFFILTANNLNEQLWRIKERNSLLVLDWWNNLPTNYRCSWCESDFQRLTDYWKKLWVNFYYWIYNSKPQKNVDHWSWDITKLYFVWSAWVTTSVTSNFTLYWWFKTWSNDINQFNTNWNIETIQWMNDDKTFNFKIIEWWNIILNASWMHWLYSMWEEFRTNNHNDAIWFENYATKDWDQFQKLHFYQFDWNEYKEVFNIDSINASWFTVWWKKYLIIKRFDWKAYFYKFDERKKTYILDWDIKWDDFQIQEINWIKYFVSNQYISKIDWLWFLSVFKFDWNNLVKLTEWSWVVSDEFSELQNNNLSLWNMKNRIFWFKKWSKFKVYFFNDSIKKLKKIENWRDNTWYFVDNISDFWDESFENFKNWKNLSKFICFWKICWVNKWENNKNEFFYIDDEWMLKRLWNDKKIKLFSVYDSINQLSIVNWKWVHLNWNQLNWWNRNICNEWTWWNSCNSYFEKDEFIKEFDLNQYINYLDKVLVLENWDTVIKVDSTDWNYAWSLYLYWNKNLLKETWNTWINYDKLSSIWKNFYLFWKWYRNWRNTTSSNIIFWFTPKINFFLAKYYDVRQCSWNCWTTRLNNNRYSINRAFWDWNHWNLTNSWNWTSERQFPELNWYLPIICWYFDWEARQISWLVSFEKIQNGRNNYFYWYKYEKWATFERVINEACNFQPSQKHVENIKYKNF